MEQIHNPYAVSAFNVFMDDVRLFQLKACLIHLKNCSYSGNPKLCGSMLTQHVIPPEHLGFLLSQEQILEEVPFVIAFGAIFVVGINIPISNYLYDQIASSKY